MILVIDNTKDLARIALLSEDSQTLYYKEVNSPKARSGKILQAIKTGLKKIGKDYADIQAVGWINGFGSFTSLRVTATIVNGLGYGLQIPVVTTSWLEVASTLAPKPNTVIWQSNRGDFFVAKFTSRSEKTTVEIKDKLPKVGGKVISNATALNPEILLDNMETKELFLAACKILSARATKSKGKPYLVSLPLYIRPAV